MNKANGWLLDLFEDPRDGLVLYFITETGQRLRLHQPFPIVFYVQATGGEISHLQRYLNEQPQKPRTWLEARKNVFTRQQESVLAVEIANCYDQPAFFRQMAQHFPDQTYYDADIQISLRYAAITGVYPLAYCTFAHDAQMNLLDVHALETPWQLQHTPVPFRTLLLKPDTAPAHAAPQQIIMQCGKNHYTLPLEPARTLLLNLRAILQRHDPDILLAEWGDTWLMPYLIKLSKQHQLPLPLNRETHRATAWQKERSYFSYGKIVYRGQQVRLFGRCHIDCHNAMLWQDCEFEGALEITRVTALPIQTAVRVSPGTGISAIEILTALRSHILVPWQKQEAEMLKPASELFAADQGGLIFQPTLGVHENVAEIDFVSLYPTIMTHFNISPETILPAGQAPNRIPQLGLSIDATEKGLVPRALAPLLEKRVQLKALQNSLPAWHPDFAAVKQKASALKWLLITCFGYLGYKNARFGRIEAHQAVTAYAREVMLQTKEIAEEMGYEMLHLYVDGMWLRQPQKSTPEDFAPLLQAIKQRIGLTIALDGIFRWVVFLPSRQNINRPVPNRYFGIFQDGSIKIRGVYARQHDAAPFIAQTQWRIFELLAAYTPPAEALPEIIAHLQNKCRLLRAHQVPLADLIIKQSLGKKLEAYRTPSPAARAARQLEKAGKTLRAGQRVPFIYTLGKPGVYAWDLPEAPNPRSLDIERYLTLLLRAAATVLQSWMDEETLVAKVLFGNDFQPALPEPVKKPRKIHTHRTIATPSVPVYDSGCASSAFSLRVSESTTN